METLRQFRHGLTGVMGSYFYVGCDTSQRDCGTCHDYGLSGRGKFNGSVRPDHAQVASDPERVDVGNSRFVYAVLPDSLALFYHLLDYRKGNKESKVVSCGICATHAYWNVGMHGLCRNRSPVWVLEISKIVAVKQIIRVPIAGDLFNCIEYLGKSFSIGKLHFKTYYAIITS